jgi:hypothetical protein
MIWKISLPVLNKPKQQQQQQQILQVTNSTSIGEFSKTMIFFNDIHSFIHPEQEYPGFFIFLVNIECIIIIKSAPVF